MAQLQNLLLKNIQGIELWKTSRKDLEIVRAEIQAYLKKNKSNQDKKVIFQIELINSFSRKLRLELKKTKAMRLLIQLDNIQYSHFEDLEIILDKIKRTKRSVFTTETQFEKLEKHELDILDFLDTPDENSIFASKINRGFGFVLD